MCVQFKLSQRLYLCILVGAIPLITQGKSKDIERHTLVTIQGDKFYINGKPTYEGRRWKGHLIEGLLINSRIVNGVFDDLNPETREQWAYPDTKKWDPDRNNREYVEHMKEWRDHGLLAFTLNPQGGSPIGYGNRGWLNAGYFEDGSLRPKYMARLEKILDRADELGMVVILGLFYFGEDEVLQDEDAIFHAVDNMMHWLFQRRYRNIIIEIDNECDVTAYDHEILKPARVHEMIRYIKSKQRHGYRFLTGTSFKGNTIATPSVVKASDFILLHGNGVGDPNRITEIVRHQRLVDGYRPMPILFTEDDHYDFDKPFNNFIAAIQSYAGWGYWDWRHKGEGFEHGFTLPPIDYGINSERKKAYFRLLKEITGY